MPDYQRISEEVLHDFGFFGIAKRTFHESTTDTTFARTLVTHIGAVAVLPVFDNNDVVLIEQYRATIEEPSLEVVAGRRDVDGESPEMCAHRELLEEVAVQASELSSLGYTYSSPGVTNEKLFLYLAQGCEFVEANEPDGIEEQLAVVHTMPITNALDMVMDGVIVDAKSVVTLLRAAHMLGVVSY
jgi:nudix-type nucleoside diphosphatase (YffH/AdpP family)